MKRLEEYTNVDYSGSTDLLTGTFQGFQAFLFNKLFKKMIQNKLNESFYSPSN